MRIVALSDMHGKLPKVPDCDILIIAGDLCPVYNHTRSFQSNWLADVFNPWLCEINAVHKVVIAGNHDWIFYDAKGLVPKLGCTYLENNDTIIEGLKIWGSPWSIWFNDWAFNFERNSTAGAYRLWEQIPDGVDILITHGPSLGNGDIVYNAQGKDPQHVGDEILLEQVSRARPKLHVFGHIHTADKSQDSRKSIIQHLEGSVTICYNVSVLDENYKLYPDKITIIEI